MAHLVMEISILCDLNDISDTNMTSATSTFLVVVVVSDCVANT